MENKLAIAIVALMVAALAAPAVMADVTYTASVVTSSVTVTPANTAFGDLLAGNSKEITGSLTLDNSGAAAADVDAKFTTNDGEATPIYGLTTASNDVIGGSNFQIGTNGNEITLNDAGTNIQLTASNRVPASGSASYDAILNVPSGQAAGVYSGNVQLTFTAVAP